MNPEIDYKKHWDEKFRTRNWGRYPPEDLVRFMGKKFSNSIHQDISILEVGCGPGANLWFLQREGYKVSGIDCSSFAIDLSRNRLMQQDKESFAQIPDLKVGDFQSLPWEDECFDVIIDIFSIYANTIEVINKTVQEIHRVLKPGGYFYSKLWGCKTRGFGQGFEIERGTFDKIPFGPCADMGITHFFDYKEIEKTFFLFNTIAIEHVIRNDTLIAEGIIEEYHCQFQKD